MRSLTCEISTVLFIFLTQRTREIEIRRQKLGDLIYLSPFYLGLLALSVEDGARNGFVFYYILKYSELFEEQLMPAMKQQITNVIIFPGNISVTLV